MGRAGHTVRVSTLVGLVLLVPACSSTVPAAPAPAPYGGPLVVTPDPGLDLWHDPGAAGKAVDCDFEVTGATSTTPFTGGEVGDTPLAALKEAKDEGSWDGPDDVQAVREEKDRVLYTYAAGGRTKLAVIVHYGPAAAGTGAGKDGLAWWVESWGRCDVSEFPAEVTDRLDYEFWTGPDGRRQPIGTVVSYPGGDCVEGTRFLELGRGKDVANGRDQVYVARGGEFEDFFAEPYRADVDLPADAVDTGYSHDGEHLWLSPDAQRAYVGTTEQVDLWPRTVQPLGCA